MGALKFSGLPDYAHGYYSQHFSWAFVPIDPMNVHTKFEVRSFTRSRDEGVAKLQTPNLDEGEAMGVGDGTVRKSVGEFV